MKQQGASKLHIHLQKNVNRLLDILENSEIISSANLVKQPQENTFINPIIIIAKGESLEKYLTLDT